MSTQWDSISFTVKVKITYDELKLVNIADYTSHGAWLIKSYF